MVLKAIVSSFDVNSEGWSVDGDPATFGWNATGGKSGGYISWSDGAAGVNAYWAAGSQYYGNRSVFYGGTISYDIKETGNDLAAAYDIILTNGTDSITKSVGGPGTDWTHFSVILNAFQGWKVGGSNATEAQIRHVLDNLTGFEIRAEYVNGTESGGLDNVMFLAPNAKPWTWQVFHDAASTDAPAIFGNFGDALNFASAGDVLVLDNPTAAKQKAGGDWGIDSDNLTIYAGKGFSASVFLSGIQTLTLSGAAAIRVIGNALDNTIIGGKGNNELIGAGGADHLESGGGKDTFVYTYSPDSTGATYDTIVHYDAARSHFLLSVSVTGIDADISGGTLRAGHFDADLGAAVNDTNLLAHHAVLFTPDHGDLKNKLFMIVDTNGSAGYQNGDLVVQLAKASHLPLKLADFTHT